MGVSAPCLSPLSPTLSASTIVSDLPTSSLAIPSGQREITIGAPEGSEKAVVIPALNLSSASVGPGLGVRSVAHQTIKLVGIRPKDEQKADGSKERFMKATGPRGLGDFSFFTFDHSSLRSILSKCAGEPFPLALSQPEECPYPIFNAEGLRIVISTDQLSDELKKFAEKLARTITQKGYSCAFYQGYYMDDTHHIHIASISDALLFANKELGLSKAEVWHLYSSLIDNVTQRNYYKSDIAPDLVNTLFEPREPDTIPEFPGTAMPYIFAKLIKMGLIHD